MPHVKIFIFHFFLFLSSVYRTCKFKTIKWINNLFTFFILISYNIKNDTEVQSNPINISCYVFINFLFHHACVNDTQVRSNLMSNNQRRLFTCHRSISLPYKGRQGQRTLAPWVKWQQAFLWHFYHSNRSLPPPPPPVNLGILHADATKQTY